MTASRATIETRAAGASQRCAVCGAALENNVKVRIADAQLRGCGACQSWVFFPRPSQAEQSGIHDDPEYFEHPYFKLRRSLGESQLRRCRDLFGRLAGVVDVVALRGHPLLDVGCDTGAFLAAAAKEFGVAPVGVDVNRNAIRLARAEGIQAYHATLEAAPADLRDFPVITAIDLIEHVADPGAFLAEIRRRLRPGGVVYLETPNIRSAVYGMGRYLSIATRGRPAALYQRLFPPQHIQYFTCESLSRLAQSAGLDVVALERRRLPSKDIAASGLVRAAMSALQAIDSLTRERILIWAVLRRGPETAQ